MRMFSLSFLGYKLFCHTLMPELVIMHNSGNSAADISLYMGGCFEYESRKSSVIQITLKTAASRKHAYIRNFDPRKPYVLFVKLGFTGVCTIFSSPKPKVQGELL